MNRINQMEPSQEEITHLVDLAITNGIIKKSGENSYAPVKLTYHPFSSSQELYDLTTTITRAWQKLIFFASCDDYLFQKMLQKFCCDDPLNCNFLRIHRLKPKQKNRPWFNFPRCDYMIDQDGVPKLIEYNLLAVSMTAHSEHYQQVKKLLDSKHQAQYIDSRPNEKLVESIHQLYCDQSLKGLFLFIVQNNETNIIEQRFIQFGLLKKGIKSKRITLMDATTKLIRNENNDLMLGSQKVSIAYFRAGYKLQDYQEDWDGIWQLREMIELSNAIKIPTVTMELFNCKRIQTELSKEEVYCNYLNKQQGDILKLSVAKQWEFDQMTEQDFQDLFKQISMNKTGYVLKPNCQGGGNNFFNEEVFEELSRMSAEERKRYILMERINSMRNQNILINGSQYQKVQCDYEVSHYGAIYGKNKELKTNIDAGFLIRVKPASKNEGGIMGGVGGICSWIIEDKIQ